jgi:hypothetical protein
MKRPVALVAAWVLAAAAAIGVGFLAVSLIDASAATPEQPGLAATTSATEAAGPTASAAASGEQSTAGGTVYASCVDGTAQLAGAPAAGWTVESAPGQVEFRDGASKIEVRADCSTGSPQFTVEGPTADAGGGDDAPPATTPGTTSPSATVDDHGGNRSGGGHGSDD